MANPGLGYRSVWSVLCEINLHLIEPLVNTQTAGNVVAPGLQAVLVASTNSMYPGAVLIIDPNTPSQEAVTVTAFAPGTSFTANFAKPHLAGAVVIAGTFPTQAIAGDPFFTQAEFLGYLSRAQNEFLARVPSIFQLSSQLVSFGQLYQNTPANCIEIHRIAVSNPDILITSLTRTANVVTAITASPHGLQAGAAFSVLGTTTSPLSDPTFVGAFSVVNILSTNSFTYQQYAANSSSTGGYIGLWTRMYEVSQEQLAMQNRNWQVVNQPFPVSWFEDRTGLYRWGVGGKPSSNFPVELLCSIRDTDTLAMTDGFLVPDLVVHYIKYRALQYAWSKDGEQRNPEMASYCEQRFEMGLKIVERWLEGME